ncbi:DUF1826 domain-containing protein [uncultured Sphingomonas sp.]|uniref:DUF1826 domain-containing protein n=1 Tax=uncultured Sphingomonas sp. TaxID=158754 RepID=UPI0025F66711|nr:DUF1826 domain-containing protein [uncultured Sphingomonas sp.]
MSPLLAASWSSSSSTAVFPNDDRPDHVVTADTIDDLAAILGTGVNLAICPRVKEVRVPAERALASVDDVAFTAAVGSVGPHILEALFVAGYEPAVIPTIAADVAQLASCLGRIGDCASVDIRLDVIETDACRKFHADFVSVRLICTYVGAGTQWLSNDAAARLRAGADIGALPIRQLATGDVALFKGRRWADDGAIVHRSPPIAGTGARRLVLVIDPAREAQAADFDRA